MSGTEENGELVDDAALFLLQLFLDVKIVMMNHLADIRKTFGPITSNVANDIFKVKRLLLNYTFTHHMYIRISGCL